MKSTFLALLFLVVICNRAFADDPKTITITDQLRHMTAAQAGLLPNFNPPVVPGVAVVPPDPTEVPSAAMGPIVQAFLPTLADNEYCVVHVVRLNPGSGATSIDKQHWYLFRKKKGSSPFENSLSKAEYNGTRIYGVKRLAFIYIYLNIQNDPQKMSVTYKVDITSKKPDNIQNLLALLKFVAAPAAADAAPDAYVVAKELDVSYSPSDVKFSAYTTPTGSASPALLTSTTFDNEGKYYWDIDFSVPLKSYKDIELDQTGTTIQAKSITRQNVFATFEFYPIPVDTKRAKAVFVPSLVAGIPISGKPLDRYVVALGLGTNYFRGFVGLGIDKRVTTSTGTTALAGDQWVRKLSFGVIVPLRPVLAAFKTSSTKGN